MKNQNMKGYIIITSVLLYTLLLLPQVTSDSLTTTLLNTRLLSKHSDDILDDIALVMFYT